MGFVFSLRIQRFEASRKIAGAKNHQSFLSAKTENAGISIFTGIKDLTYGTITDNSEQNP